MNHYESPSAHIERSLLATDLIAVAYKKKQNIIESPYYEVFGTYGERMKDLLQIDMVINRLQSWFYQSIQKARETRI